MKRLNKQDLERALSLLDLSISDLDKCEDLKRLELDAVKKWHPDRAIGAGLNENEIERYTTVFQKIPVCIEVFEQYKSGNLVEEEEIRSKKVSRPDSAPEAFTEKKVSFDDRLRSVFSADTDNAEKLRILSALYSKIQFNLELSKKYGSVLNNASFQLFTKSIEQNNTDLAISLLSIDDPDIQKSFSRYIASLALDPKKRSSFRNLLMSDSLYAVLRPIQFVSSKENKITDRGEVLLELTKALDVLKRGQGNLKWQVHSLLKETIQTNNPVMARKILAGGGLSVVKKQNYCLSLALDLKNAKFAKLLLKAGANPNELLNKKTRWTLLMDRIKKDDASLIKLLVKYGGDVNAIIQTSYGWSPLLEAVDNDRAETVKVLLKAGADPNYTNKNGWNAVKLARTHKNADVLKLLNKAM